MIDKDILPNLGYSDVAGMLHENQELMDKLQKNPELNLVSGISFEEFLQLISIMNKLN